MNAKELIIQHIKERLDSFKELGQAYSDEKIDALAENLSKTGKPLTEIFTLIDNKFSNQLRKIKHDDYLASLKEYYLANIDKLEKGNNCYLLSYDQGVKVLEQAYIKEEKELNSDLKEVLVNNNKKGYQKINSKANDYELIISDIAYLLKIDYASTYRVFDEKMEPQGILHLSFTNPQERFLNFEEVLRYIKEESPKFNLKQELIEYHDRHLKMGLKKARSKEDYQSNIDYVLKMFKALPDITDNNIAELRKKYLNMKVFELLTNSLDNNLENIGLMVNKESLKKYTYRLSPSFNKYTTTMDNLNEDETICNFYIVDKKELLINLMKKYYDDIKGLLSLIANNNETLKQLTRQVIKEHLEFEQYEKYSEQIENNIDMISDLVKAKKEVTPDTEEDQMRNEDNEILFRNRISPISDNYVSEEYEDSDRGSTIITAIITFILFVTIGIILLAILALSKMNI